MPTSNKTKLRGSTAKLALVPAPTTPAPKRSNAPKLTEALVDQYVQEAMADDDVANHKKGTAQQRMSAALMAQHEFWVSLGDKIPGYEGQSVPSLAECFHDDEVRKGYVMMFRDRFIKSLTDDEKKDMDGDKIASHDLANRAKRTLIDTSIKVAAVLAKQGVKFTDFDHATGMFEVNPDILLPLHAVWKGTLGSKDAPATIALDLTGYSACNTKINLATGKRVDGTPLRIKASVLQLLAAEATRYEDKATGKVGRKPRQRKAMTLKQTIEAVGPAENCILPGDYLIAALNALFEKATDRNLVFSSKGWVGATDFTVNQEGTQAAPGFDKEKLDKLNKLNKAA